LDVIKTVVGSAVFGRIANEDNTNAASHAKLRLHVGGASGGDPFISWLVNGVTEWSAGIDNSDSDKWKISGSSALGTSDYLVIDTSGTVYFPVGILNINAGKGELKHDGSNLLLSAVTGDLVLVPSTTVRPSTDNAKDLGAASFQWRDIYIGRDTYVGGTKLFETDRDLAVSLLPNADNSLNLGSATRFYAGVFARIIKSDATGVTFGASTDKFGWWGAAAVVRDATAFTQTYATASHTHTARTASTLTDNTGGTADTTLQSIGVVYSQTEVRNNFADLAAQVNNLKTDSENTAQVLNALLDTLQSYGIVT
jgi:hypothetical protein